MAERLKGKIAIVTGAARGIGAVTSEFFIREGAAVALWDEWIRSASSPELLTMVTNRVAALADKTPGRWRDWRARLAMRLPGRLASRTRAQARTRR